MLEINRYSNGEQSLIEKEGLEKIYSAINSLTMKNREILELSRFEGLKNQEIAELLHIPIRTVETRLFRALKKLRELL
jgi:RNA polymerase sigma-70 factor (ECF subfamily)